MKPTRLLIGVAVAGMVAMWVYVLYLAIGPGRQDPPDTLADPAFATAAEERCDAALDVVRQLPPASSDQSATERAGVIDEANAAFSSMLDDLAGLTSLASAGEDRQIVRAWLDDWRTYLGDREDYADALREDPGARMLVSPKKGQHITEYIDAFAQDNHMPACSTPLDVA